MLGYLLRRVLATIPVMAIVALFVFSCSTSRRAIQPP